MANMARVAPTLLLHVNLLLTLYAGAILSSSVRLKWDPTLYIAARELFPLEYRSAAVVLTTVGFTLLLLAQLALTALSCSRLAVRRALLILFATTTLVVVWCEVAWAGWVTLRVLRWIRSSQAEDLRHAAQISDHLEPLLQHLAHFHPLPEKVKLIIQEAKEDLPQNLYVLVCAAGIMIVLQVLAAALALLAAHSLRRPRAHIAAYDTGTTTTPLRYTLAV